jgi:hypothetical protein
LLDQVQRGCLSSGRKDNAHNWGKSLHSGCFVESQPSVDEVIKDGCAFVLNQRLCNCVIVRHLTHHFIFLQL